MAKRERYMVEVDANTVSYFDIKKALGIELPSNANVMVLKRISMLERVKIKQNMRDGLAGLLVQYVEYDGTKELLVEVLRQWIKEHEQEVQEGE